MKKSVLLLVILLFVSFPLLSAAEKGTDKISPDMGIEDSTAEKGTDKISPDMGIEKIGKDLSNISKQTNPWNETVIISPVWQTLLGGFFGLNLHKESTAISVREAITLFSIFILFLIIIQGILKLTPLFKGEFGGVSSGFLASLIVTMLISITGAFISLKNLFMEGVEHTINKLDWQILHWMIDNPIGGVVLTIFVVFPIAFLIYEGLSWIGPIIEKYSKESRAGAKGRMIGRNIRINSENVN
jgi:hypothetical protein